MQDSVIHARGMLRDFRKAESMDHAILHGNPFGSCFVK